MELFFKLIIFLLQINAAIKSVYSDDIIRHASEGYNNTFPYSNKYLIKADLPEGTVRRICENADLSFRKKDIKSHKTQLFKKIRNHHPRTRKTGYVTLKEGLPGYSPGRCNYMSLGKGYNGNYNMYICVDETETRRRKRGTRNVAKETSLKSNTGVTDAIHERYVPKTTNVQLRRKRAVSVSDPQWSAMWHIHPSHSPSMNVYEAWGRGYTGSGVYVGVVDSGLDVDHSDLISNYRSDLSYDYISGDNDPSHSVSDNGHGTNCAGIIAAVANTECSIGVAYESKFAALRILDAVDSSTESDTAQALSHESSTLDIYSNSWGYVTDGESVSGLDETIAAAFTAGISNGRSGHGSIYTFAAGNENDLNEDTNAHEILTSIYVITIGSVSPDGSPAYYSNPGASVLAATYGGDLLDNAVGIITANRDNGCSTDFQGTSAACPVASGIIALALHANPNLGWRDVQELIVRTSSTSGLSGDTIMTNGAGYTFSNYFGFGLMNAEEIVNKAASWTNLDASSSYVTPLIYTDMNYDSYSDVYSTKDVSDCDITRLEHIQVRVAMYADSWGKVAIYLTSPAGTRSRLMRHRPLHTLSGTYYLDYKTVHFWGEGCSGSWKLELEGSGRVAKRIVYWRLSMYGIKTNGGICIMMSKTVAVAMVFVISMIL